MIGFPRLRPTGRARPRLLLVDDNRAMLDRLSSLLATEFHIAGTATDGRQALDMTTAVTPDAIVLDISMPGLSGFQTMRRLEQAGSRAPVVFLSAFDTANCIHDAFRCGGRGYVVKSHVDRDLATALDLALDRRWFVPSLTPLLELMSGGGHAMHIYDDRERFLDGLALLFELALRRGDATCLVATEGVRDGLRERLRRRGWEVDRPSGHPRYLAMDAGEALSSVMRNGLPDEEPVAKIALELDQYRRAVGQGTPPRLTISGNMVMLLLEQGQSAAATMVENQWHRLTADLPFFTLCGYAESAFLDPGGLWSSVCKEHHALAR